MLITAALNILLSIVFGVFFGIFGILLATAVARILTSVWYEPPILYSSVFQCSAKSYWKKQGKYALLTVVALVLSFLAVHRLPVGIGYFILKAVIVIVISVVVFIGANTKTPEAKEIVRIIKKQGT